MRALVIVHEPGSEPVLVGERLTQHGYELTEVVIAPDMGDPVGSAVGLGDPTDYDVVVPMGSTFSLTDPDRISSWIHDELDFLRRADAAGVPVFGICFGGQALAAAHGGRVVKAERAQIGWCPLEPSGDAPLGGPWMQWHYDRFELPSDPGVEVLATDAVGVQAFTLRRNLGVQFHPEVTPDHVALWVASVPADELRAAGTEPGRLVRDAEAILDDVRGRTNALVDWFLTDVATR